MKSLRFNVFGRRVLVTESKSGWAVFYPGEGTRIPAVDIKLPPVERHVAAGRSWPGHEKMIAEFNRALAVAQQDGSLEAIIKKWDARYGGVK